MELTLGPVLFEWKRDELLRFYDEVSGMDVDRVYIGEVVCSKKAGLTFKDMENVAGMLERSGKKVTFSSLAVVSNEEELEFTRRLASLGNSIEANDISVLNMINPAEKEVFSGPHITTYNVPSVDFLKGIGVKRVTFPVELPRGSMSYIMKHTQVPGEAFVHGKAPLAFSWRCYTSRAYDLSKTDCRHHCGKYPEGMELKTLEKEPLFNINGTSILSAKTYTLIEFIEELKEDGVGAIRVSPQQKGTGKIAGLFRKRINGEIGPGESYKKLKEISAGEAFCNGWYPGGAGKDYASKGA